MIPQKNVSKSPPTENVLPFLLKQSILFGLFGFQTIANSLCVRDQELC